MLHKRKCLLRVIKLDTLLDKSEESKFRGVDSALVYKAAGKTGSEDSAHVSLRHSLHDLVHANKVEQGLDKRKTHISFVNIEVPWGKLQKGF